MTAGALFLSPGANAHGLQIGPIVFPDINPPATIDQSKPTQVRQPEWMKNDDGTSLLNAERGDVIILIPEPPTTTARTSSTGPAGSACSGTHHRVRRR